MNDTRVTFIEEPTLQFGHGQDAIDPHDGLSFFGPFDLKHPQSPPHAVIGTAAGIQSWRYWSAAINRAHAVAKIEKFKLWPPYPGYAAAFGGHWNEKPVAEYELSAEILSEGSRKREIHARCGAVVQEYMKYFASIRKLDTRPAIVICIVPDEVYKNCRPDSKVANPSDKLSRIGKAKSNNAEDDSSELAPDFRRQLKALVMAFDMPIQIMLESTLRLSDDYEFGKRGLTPVSDRMWNLDILE